MQEFIPQQDILLGNLNILCEEEVINLWQHNGHQCNLDVFINSLFIFFLVCFNGCCGVVFFGAFGACDVEIDRKSRCTKRRRPKWTVAGKTTSEFDIQEYGTSLLCFKTELSVKVTTQQLHVQHYAGCSHL